ncbi:MAG TPA: hypothetical protein VKT72_02495, partial [Candidatus Baltobacteraceae bacterium]|nr:hypothetical protein [Candidatus Baltobacteraceae bacterium]
MIIAIPQLRRKRLLCLKAPSLEGALELNALSERSAVLADIEWRPIEGIENQVFEIGPSRITRMAFTPCVRERTELLPYVRGRHDNWSEQITICDPVIYQPRYRLIKPTVHQHSVIYAFAQRLLQQRSVVKVARFDILAGGHHLWGVQ